jgi:hypothetical protein
MNENPESGPLPDPAADDRSTADEPYAVPPPAAPVEPLPPGTPSLGAVPGLLARTAPWAHLLAIIGFVSVGLMILVGVGAGAVGLATGRAETAALMVIYPLSALVYFFPSLYMLQYAKRSRRFAQGDQSLAELEAALDAQRRFFKFAAIATVVGVALGVLVFVGVMLFSILASAVDV